MIYTKSGLVIIGLFILLPCISTQVKAQAIGKLGALSLYEKEINIQGEDRKGPYFLPDSLIIQDSETLFLDDVELAKTGYELDYIKGELRFTNSVAKKALIKLKYKVLPVVIKNQYYHRLVKRRVLDAPTGSADEYKVGQPREEQEDMAANLTKSGSITRGVTVGSNRGLKVNSSLNINVSGKVADNVQVLAALTDQTTPIQPEGTTQNLQEIDKVFVQIKSPNLSATMGDFQLNYSATEFANYNRKLQGAMGKADYDNLQLTVSGAVSRGKYISTQFMGQEGYQGPYQLKGDHGQIDIIVLAGTERVYIDGQQMVRGETNDYIIDYASAQITFTRGRLITSDSRVVVDFQYSDEKFRRNLYSTEGVAAFWDNRVKLTTTLLREADDKNNPLDYTLTEERLAVLQNAGDNPQPGVSGETFVGDGKGNYTRNELGYFVYAGADSGNYQVSFSDVGDGSGSYRYKGAGIFDFVGENAGRYAPIISLTPAKSHSMMDFALELMPLRFIQINGEIAVSEFDENMFSSLDDHNNQGVAQKWSVALKQEKFKALGVNWGRVELGGKYKQVDNLFRDIDRTSEIEYNRRWDIPTLSDRGEKSREINSAWSPFTGFSVGGEYGSIDKGEYFSSDRWEVTSSMARPKLPEYDARVERIMKKDLLQRQKGDWFREKGSTSYKLWKFRPFINYEGEIKKETWSDSLYTGFKFNDITGGLEFTPNGKLKTSAKVSQRDDSNYKNLNQFQKTSRAITQNYQVQLQNIRSFMAGFEYTHRERTFNDPTIGNKRTDLAEARMQYSPWKKAVNSSFNYQISNTATAKKERIYIKVSEGDGNYRFDELLNEYVNDPLGDYIMRVLTTDEFLPVIEIKASGRVRLEPARIWGKTGNTKQQKQPRWKKTTAALSSETFAAVEENSQEKDVWSIYLMDFSKFRQPETTVLGNFQFRQDLFLFENNRDFSVRLRHKSRDEINNQYLEGGQNRNELERSALITARFSSKTSSQTEITRLHTEKTFDFSGRQNRNIYASRLKTNISVRPASPLELAMEGRYSMEEDRFYADPTKLKALAFVPRVNYSLQQKGRLSAEFEWSSVTSSPGGRTIPYEMAEGRSLGKSTRWDIRFDYKISQTMHATFSYSGRNEPERDRTIHTARAQVTAAFR